MSDYWQPHFTQEVLKKRLRSYFSHICLALANMLEVIFPSSFNLVLQELENWFGQC